MSSGIVTMGLGGDNLILFGFGSENSPVIDQIIEGGGLNSRRVSRGTYKRPRYWWEIDPEIIPDDLPLPDALEEIEEEEQALASAITDLVRDRVVESTLRILRAYAQILAEQRAAKEVFLAKPAKRVNDSDSERLLTVKTLKRKRLLLMT